MSSDEEEKQGGEEMVGEGAGDEPVVELNTEDNVKRLLAEALDEAERWLSRRDYPRAARSLSRAITVAQSSGDQALVSDLYLRRSAAYASHCSYLRNRPAAASERAALYDQDPLDVAEMALSDSAKGQEAAARANVTDVAKIGAAHGQRGRCLFLLERYEEARTAYLEGLAVDPTLEELGAALKEVKKVLEESEAPGGEEGGEGGENANAQEAESPGARPSGPVRQGSRRRNRLEANHEDVECIICSRLLYQPVTTPCGHSFCKSCLFRALDHSTRCPTCRSVIHARTLPVTLTLHNILSHSYPQEYAERAAEEAATTAGGDEAPLPLFVMSLMLPGQKMALNIFEPRYRLMVRRVMAGSKRFGMACAFELPSGETEVFPIAVECEITECQALPDGRFYLEILGRRRIRLGEVWDLDGYRVARPVAVVDAKPEPGSEAAQRLERLGREVDELATALFEALRRATPRGRIGRLADLLADVGDKPPMSDLEAFSFYAAQLVFADGRSKMAMLETTSTEERLGRIKEILQTGRREGREGGDCVLM